MSDERVTEPTTAAEDAADDSVVDRFGYKGQLRRSMGRFSTFAISFSLVSVTTGVFANYAFGLDTAGPSFIWTWLVVGVGNVVVALVLAHLSVHVPLAGYAYQWPSRMVNKRFGWFPGWLALAGWLAGTPGVAYALAQYLAPYVGWGSAQGTIVVVTVGILATWMIIHLVGLRLASWINNASVVTEILGTLLVGIGLLVTVLVRHSQHPGFIFSGPVLNHPATIPLLASSALVAAYSLTGFEGAADLAEEAHDPRKSVPFAMIWTIILSTAIGFVVLLGFTLAIPNLTAAEKSPVPLLEITQHYLGGLTPIFMVLVFISIYACGLINLAAMTRLGWSMSRDNMLPFSRALAKVSGSKVPYVAVIAGTVLSALFVLVAQVEAVITSVASIVIYLAYALVIIGGLRVGRTSTPREYFSVGRAFLPLAVTSLVWIVALVIALVIAPGSWTAPLATLAVLAIGVVWYFVRVRHLVTPR